MTPPIWGDAPLPPESNDIQEFRFRPDSGLADGLQSSVEVAPDDFATWRLNTANDVLECDAAMRRLWEFDEDAVITGREAISRVHHEDAEGLRASIAQSLRDGSFYQKDFRIVLPNGQIRWIASRAKPIHGPGDVEYLSGLNWDITREHRNRRALAASERLRRVALDAARMGVWEFELASGTLRWDAHCRQLFGFDGKATPQVNTPAALELIHPDDRASVLAVIGRATQSSEDEDYSVEYRIHVDDEERWIRTVARCAFKLDPTGPVPERLLGVNQDITARRQAEAKAFAEAELSRIALKSAELGTWEFLLDESVAQLDERCADLLGMEGPGPHALNDILDGIHADDRPEVEAAMANALDASGPGHFTTHYRVKGPGGEERWLRSVGQVHFAPATDLRPRHAERFLGVLMDDTVRRQNEDQLRKWQGILLGGGWGSATVRPEVERSLVLPQTLQARAEQSLIDPERLEALYSSGLIDAPPSEVLNRITEMACRLLKAPVSLVSLVESDRQFFAAQSGFTGAASEARQTPISHSFCQHVTTSAAPFVVPDSSDNPVVRDNPSVSELSVRAYLGVPLLTNEGLAVGALCSISDTTRSWTNEDLGILQNLAQLVMTEITLRTYVRKNQRAQRAAEAANLAKSEFLANMSHEIRTPMSAILGYADILARNESDPDNLELVETIRRNGSHLLEILNDILDLAKIESGKFEVRSEWMEVHDVIEEVVSMLDGRSRERGLELTVRYLTDLPERILGDATRLRQILVNLVGNAIKFTDSGSVAIELEFDAAARRLEIAVVDTGVGIDPDEVERLFEPFTQADGTSQRVYGGTGLGLTICRRFAAALGGELTATSEPGEGSRFVLSIPVGDVESVPLLSVDAITARSHAPRPPDTAHVEPLTGYHILVVDDRRELRTLVQMLLEEAGATVTTANNGVEAVEAYEARSDSLDAVLMDMQMPVMDGYTASRKLRDLGATLPIIAVTAHALSGEQERCLDAGCSAYVTKPLDGAALLSLLATELRTATA